MPRFRDLYPHNVEKISPIYEYEPYKISYDDFKHISATDYYYRRESYRTDRMEITINYRDYQRLEDYVDEKIKIDNFIRENESAAKLYDQIMVLYHLTR